MTSFCDSTAGSWAKAEDPRPDPDMVRCCDFYVTVRARILCTCSYECESVPRQSGVTSCLQNLLSNKSDKAPQYQYHVRQAQNPEPHSMGHLFVATVILRRTLSDTIGI